MRLRESRKSLKMSVEIGLRREVYRIVGIVLNTVQGIKWKKKLMKTSTCSLIASSRVKVTAKYLSFDIQLLNMG